MPRPLTLVRFVSSTLTQLRQPFTTFQLVLSSNNYVNNKNVSLALTLERGEAENEFHNDNNVCCAAAINPHRRGVSRIESRAKFLSNERAPFVPRASQPYRKRPATTPAGCSIEEVWISVFPLMMRVVQENSAIIHEDTDNWAPIVFF